MIFNNFLNIYAEKTNPPMQHAIIAIKQTIEIKKAILGQDSPWQQHPFWEQQQQGQQQQQKYKSQANY